MDEGTDNLYPGLDTSATWELLQNLLIEPGAWLPGAGAELAVKKVLYSRELLQIPSLDNAVRQERGKSMRITGTQILLIVSSLSFFLRSQVSNWVQEE